MAPSVISRTPVPREARGVPLLGTDPKGQEDGPRLVGERRGLQGDQLALTHHESHDLGPHLRGSI